MPQPVALRSHTVSGYLEIEWDDGVVSRLPHRFLRMHCRCAECAQGRRSGQVAGESADIGLVGVQPYGPESVQLQFSDGHSTGIYPFPYLRELAALAGLSSEPELS